MLQYIRTTDLSEDQISSIETAHISSLSLLDTVNDIIDLRQIEMGKLKITPKEEPASRLRIVVKEIVEILPSRLMKKS